MRTTRRIGLKRKAAFAAIAGALATGILAAPAMAVSVGGGTWYYGVDSGTNWSEYYHTSLVHRASVSNGNGLVRSSCYGPYLWAYAEEPSTLTGNQAYWSWC